MLQRVRATRYVLPLREGGSMPGLVEADDDGMYVVKLRGAGQGVKVLVAEVIVGEIGRRLGLAVPDLVVVDMPAAVARYEADEEVQDLLDASLGDNLGLDFLPGAFGYDGSQPPPLDVAARIVWLDAFTANVDRTWSNPNLLVWHREVWAIDHGAAIWFHHAWPSRGADASRFAAQPFDRTIDALVGALTEVRKHAGFMVPAPVQAAMVAVLTDDGHVAAQNARYARRRDVLTDAVCAFGLIPDPDSAAGLYIWARREDAPCSAAASRELTREFAERGILVAPGSFYGAAGGGYVRIALSATDEQIAAAAARLR